MLPLTLPTIFSPAMAWLALPALGQGDRAGLCQVGDDVPVDIAVDVDGGILAERQAGQLVALNLAVAVFVLKKGDYIAVDHLQKRIGQVEAGRRIIDDQLVARHAAGAIAAELQRIDVAAGHAISRRGHEPELAGSRRRIVGDVTGIGRDSRIIGIIGESNQAGGSDACFELLDEHRFALRGGREHGGKLLICDRRMTSANCFSALRQSVFPARRSHGFS